MHESLFAHKRKIYMFAEQIPYHAWKYETRKIEILIMFAIGIDKEPYEHDRSKQISQIKSNDTTHD